MSNGQKDGQDSGEARPWDGDLADRFIGSRPVPAVAAKPRTIMVDGFASGNETPNNRAVTLEPRRESAGIAVHPSHLTTIVDLLEDEVAALRKVAEAARELVQAMDARAKRAEVRVAELEAQLDNADTCDQCLQLPKARARVRELEAEVASYQRVVREEYVKREALEAQLSGVEQLERLNEAGYERRIAELEELCAACADSRLERAERAEARVAELESRLRRIQEIADDNAPSCDLLVRIHEVMDSRAAETGGDT